MHLKSDNSYSKVSHIFVFIASSIFFFFFTKKATSFEAFPQPKKMLFLNPYAGFSWNNNSLGNNRFDNHNKIKSFYYGLFFEYGLTEKITIGADGYLNHTWTSTNGTIGGKPFDKAFSLEGLQIFGRYNILHKNGFAISLYTSLFFPPLGKGSGKLDYYDNKFEKWNNKVMIEFGYRFSNHSSMTFNIGYQANYNQTRDYMVMKLTYFTPLWYDFCFYGTLTKRTYVNKGNSLYGFYTNNKFDIDAFNFITKNSYVALDLFIGKQIKKGVYIVLAYTRSLDSVVFGNKGMKLGYNAFWLEGWIFLR